MPLIRTLLLLCVLLLTGCCSIQDVSSYTQQKDPMEPLNRSIFNFNDALDRHLIKPVAQGYADIAPDAAQNMVSNFFSNLDDVIVTANDLLQLKFRQAASDGSRVIINSTFGLFGMFNITTRLPKHNEDFGQTLGYWGMPSGPYLVLPVLGPSSLRDTVGLYGDSYTSVISNTEHIPTRNSAWALKGLSIRAGLLQQEKVLDGATIDRYSFLRDAYLMRQENRVYDGNPPRPNYDEEDME